MVSKKSFPRCFWSGIQPVTPRNHGCPTEALGHDEATLRTHQFWTTCRAPARKRLSRLEGPGHSWAGFGAVHDDDQIASIAVAVANMRSMVVWPSLPDRPASLTRFTSGRPQKGPIDQDCRAWEFIRSRSRFRPCLPFPFNAWEGKASPGYLR